MDNKLIEELSLNHWQPLSTLLYDGWVLRFANGYIKRANSINPIHDSTSEWLVRTDDIKSIEVGKRKWSKIQLFSGSIE